MALFSLLISCVQYWYLVVIISLRWWVVVYNVNLLQIPSEDTRGRPSKSGSSARSDPPKRGGHYARFHEALASSRSSHSESSDNVSPAPVTSPAAPPSQAGISASTSTKPSVSDKGRQYSEEEHVSQATVVQQAKSAVPEIKPKQSKSAKPQQQQRSWSSDKSPTPKQQAQAQSGEKKPVAITTSTDAALNTRLASLMQVAGSSQSPTTTQEHYTTQQLRPAVVVSQNQVSPRPASIGPSGATKAKAQQSPRPTSLGQAPSLQPQPSPRSANLSSATDEALNKRLGSLFKVASGESSSSKSPTPSPSAGSSVSPRGSQVSPAKVGPPTHTKPVGVRSPRSSLSGSDQPSQEDSSPSLITTSTDDALNRRLGSLMKQAGDGPSKQGIVSPSSQSGPVVSSQAKKPQFVPATLGPQGYVAVSNKPKYFPATADIDKIKTSPATIQTRGASDSSLSPKAAETAPAASRTSPSVSPSRPVTRLQQLSLSAQDYMPVTTSSKPLSPKDSSTGGVNQQQEQRRRTSAPHTVILAEAPQPIAPPRRGSDQTLSATETAASNVPSLTPYQRRSSPMPLNIPEAHKAGDPGAREGIQSQVGHLEAPVQRTQDIQEENLLSVVTQSPVSPNHPTQSPVPASSPSPSKPQVSPGRTAGHHTQFSKFHEALAASRTAPTAPRPVGGATTTVTSPHSQVKPPPATTTGPTPVAPVDRAVPAPVFAAKKAPSSSTPAAPTTTTTTQKSGPPSPFSSPKVIRATKLQPLNATAAQTHSKAEPGISSQAKTGGGVPGRLRDRQPPIKSPPPHIASKIANLGQPLPTSTTRYDAEAVTPSTPTIVYAQVSAPEIPETTIALLDVKSVESEKQQVCIQYYTHVVLYMYVYAFGVGTCCNCCGTNSKLWFPISFSYTMFTLSYFFL